MEPKFKFGDIIQVKSDADIACKSYKHRIGVVISSVYDKSYNTYCYHVSFRPMFNNLDYLNNGYKHMRFDDIISIACDVDTISTHRRINDIFGFKEEEIDFLNLDINTKMSELFSKMQ